MPVATHPHTSRDITHYDIYYHQCHWLFHEDYPNMELQKSVMGDMMVRQLSPMQCLYLQLPVLVGLTKCNGFVKLQGMLDG